MRICQGSFLQQWAVLLVVLRQLRIDLGWGKFEGWGFAFEDRWVERLPFSGCGSVVRREILSEWTTRNSRNLSAKAFSALSGRNAREWQSSYSWGWSMSQEPETLTP